MKIIEETYHKCPTCGVEARGLIELNRVFGYWFKGEEIDLYRQCKACRGVNEFGETQEQRRMSKYRNEEWNTAVVWARKIHISGAIFTSYLVELGYLEKEAPITGKCETAENGSPEDIAESREPSFLITPKGYTHCRIKRTCMGDVVQWDFDTYVEVARLRAQMAEVHDICPKCKANLDETPKFDHLEPVHICGRCGHVCEEWGVRVIYDR